MPYGHHVATCFCCGRQWMVGDCIPSVCDDCYKAGHIGGWNCPKCVDQRMELQQRIDRVKCDEGKGGA